MEDLLAKQRKEKKELQARVTQKKKAASKKTRKGVNEESERLEKELQERHAQEVAALNDDANDQVHEVEEHDETTDVNEEDASAGNAVGDADSLVSSVQNLSVTPGSTSSPGPKKPNRAKARLAKRAADLERQAELAQEEADNLPDLKTQEKERMSSIVKTRGLQEKEVRADGHCLYAAMADQIRQRGEQVKVGSVIDLPDDFRTVRYVAADYIVEHPDDFIPFLEEDLDTYVQKIRDTGEWGGQIELMALANAYKVQIQVVHGDGNVIPIGDAPDDRKIWLAYYRHGFGLGEHYNSLREVKEKA
ncbi:cysteine proteinase [Microthyrium microscopicum]|uniref:Cysteine proteinase n=1 Tax=Microthyrium microscopicum TaxID=703497 RepID=A0A6A6UPC5_9PEZI|nr:cysteine proteinase [Microthyrium microscopicum]